MRRAACALLSIAILATLFYTSLAPLAAPQPFNHSDKWLHVLAYALVSGWFVTLFWQRRFQALLGCVALGLMIEYLQGLTQYRHADPLDALANIGGCLLGLGLSTVLVSIVGQRQGATV